MPSKTKRKPIRRGPRLQVTLTPHAMSFLDRMAKATGTRKATLVGELIESVLPALETTAKAVELAREQPREAQRLLSNFGAEAVAGLMQQQLSFDAHLGEKLDGRTVEGRRAKRRARGPTS